MLAVHDGDVFGWLLVVVLGGFAVVLAFRIPAWRQRRVAEMLERWSREQGVRVLDCHREWALFRPFFFHGKGQTIRRILVEFPDGRTAAGWVLCGSPFFGMFGDRVVVKWDKEKPEARGFPVIVGRHRD